MANEPKTNILERSVNSLQWFYTMVLSLAVVHSVQQLISYDVGTKALHLNYEYIHNFIVFLAIVIPFHQGANRYLDETYVSAKMNLNEFTGIIDFLFFFFEGMVFYVMAIFIQNNLYFYWSTILVFGVDVIWLCFVYYSNKELFSKIKWWLILNVIAVVLIFLIIISNIVLDDPEKWYLLAFLLLLRTFFDYKLTWPFYWPAFYLNREVEA